MRCDSAVMTKMSLAAFLLLLLTSVSFFIDEKLSRYSFHFCGYVSVLGFILFTVSQGIKKSLHKLSLPFLIMGLLFLLWSLWCTVSGEGEYLLYTAAKRMIVAFFIISFILSTFRNLLFSKEKLRRYALIALWVTFAAASLSGIHQALNSGDRILLGIDRPTMSAYAYSFVSLTLMMALAYDKNRLRKNITFFCTIAVSTYVIFHTQTRAAMGVHTFLIAVITFYLFPVKKECLSCLAALLVLALSVCSNHHIIDHRADQAISDVQSYQNDDDRTSLGARFSMWKVGLLSFEHRPLGETLHQRNDFIRGYLRTSGEENSDVNKYLDVHLHNEVIQYLSVFGIFGLSVLLYFYYSFIPGLRKKYGLLNCISVPMVATVFYGLTDVLFTAEEMIVISAMTITLSAIIMSDREVPQVRGR